jgi:hypothetical protein
MLLLDAVVTTPGSNGRSVWSIGFDRFDAEILGSDPAYCMDVCPRISVFFPLKVGLVQYPSVDTYLR